jgi:hypothetical protein
MEPLPTDPAELRRFLCESFLAGKQGQVLTPIGKKVFTCLMRVNYPIRRQDLPILMSGFQSFLTVMEFRIELRHFFRANVFKTLESRFEIKFTSQHRQDGVFYHLKLVEITLSDGVSNIVDTDGVARDFVDTTSKESSHVVFLCHSSGDKEEVKRLYRKLRMSGLNPWLDEEDLIPGSRWESAIRKAVKDSDIVLVCLSKSSITKEAFVQREIRFAFDVADEKPDDTIYIIPTRLEECVLPERLSHWQCVDLFRENGFDKLVRAIRSKPLKPQPNP